MATTFVPVYAAGDSAWSWQFVASELRARGHELVASELPTEPTSSLGDYADAIVAAIGDRPRVVLVAHSFGGFTAPLVCARRPIDAIVYVAAMVPAPGEPPADWWTNTGHATARPKADAERDDAWTYYHDVPPALVAEAPHHARAYPSERAYHDPWPLAAMPEVATRFLLCREDRLFPAAWLRSVVQARLGIEADEIESGHCVNLSKPAELAAKLAAYVG